MKLPVVCVLPSLRLLAGRPAWGRLVLRGLAFGGLAFGGLALGGLALGGLALAPPAAGQAPPATSPGDDYRIGPEDLLQIQVWGRPDLTSEFTVDPAGDVHLPLVGKVEARGRTTGELGLYLTGRYRLLDSSIPEVLVTIAAYNHQHASVVGEVHAPGRYGFRTMPDLWGAILAAGGSTPEADLARVQVVRREEPDGPTQTVVFDLSRGPTDIPAEARAALQIKDVVVVPSLAEGGSGGDKFQVLGAVQAPGAYRLTLARDVVEALAVSGGALPGADLRKVRLTRRAGAAVFAYELDLRGHLYEGRPIADLGLRPGDTVAVPEGRSPLGAFFDRLVRLAPIASVAATLSYLLR